MSRLRFWAVIPATQWTLTVLVSSDQLAYERALPYLQKIGKDIFYLEKPGTSTKMKLVNNLLLGTFMAAIAEALVFGERKSEWGEEKCWIFWHQVLEPQEFWMPSERNCSRKIFPRNSPPP